MLMSMMAAPIPSTMRAVSAMGPASRPAIWTLTGSAPSVSALARMAARVEGRGVTISVEATISLTISPAPCRATARRKGRSVIPAMGARNTGGPSRVSPRRIGSGCCILLFLHLAWGSRKDAAAMITCARDDTGATAFIIRIPPV
jgi:hypothetical protein